MVLLFSVIVVPVFLAQAVLCAGPVITLISCEHCGCTPLLKYIKKWAPLRQDNALFLHSSTGMLVEG